MKRLFRFIAIFLAMAVAFSVIFSIVTARELDIIKQNNNQSFLQIMALVEEKYPQITHQELVEILNGSGDTQSAEKILSSYGIDISRDWAAIENETAAEKIIIFNGAVCILICMCLSLVLIAYHFSYKREAKRITRYVEQLNNRIYDLDILENSEDELSVLKNEIYKTTVMLKEQTEISLRDKENLKNALSDISHQLKTPIASIMVMLDSILENPDMPVDMQREFLLDIRRCAGNMSFLVQSLLTLSKFDSNTIVFKENREIVSRIIEQSIDNTAVLAELKQVTVTGFADEDIYLNCDFKWLSEALTNIVKNAVEHTGEGGNVEIKAEQQKLYTKITVTDDGEGISPQDLPHIFKRFYKTKNSHRDSVGIGLSLAKAIVEKSGGIITATSKTDEGTEFVVKFFGK